MRMSIIAEEGMLTRWQRDINETMFTQELVDYIPTEWMRRNGSVTQYCIFFQKKISKPFLDEATLERNGGGCKLIHGMTDKPLVACARSHENIWPSRHGGFAHFVGDSLLHLSADTIFVLRT